MGSRQFQSSSTPSSFFAEDDCSASALPGKTNGGGRQPSFPASPAPSAPPVSSPPSDMGGNGERSPKSVSKEQAIPADMRQAIPADRRADTNAHRVRRLTRIDPPVRHDIALAVRAEDASSGTNEGGRAY